MSNFGYNQLQEEGSASSVSSDVPWTADFSENLQTSLADATDPHDEAGAVWQNGSAVTGSSDSATGSAKDSSSAKHAQSDNVKYTALKPTSVRELNESDVEREGVDNEPFDSYVRMALTGPKKKSISKIHIFICSLLIACVAIAGFGLIYVFIILPAKNGKVVYPDGQSHIEDLDKLKSYGANVAVTSCGLVKGTREGSVYVFKGIPYALPPTGDRRWKPPVPTSYKTKTCWYDVYNATEFGSKCVQPQFNDTNAIEGNEDCLYLNVWSPSLNPETLLPVMVWIHSGDFVYGSGHMPGMSPTSEIALFTNSVFVSLNYRLGAFGFLALDQLREKPRGPAGNYGFMDQQLALKWVKANIRHFGGNENKVTIFGHGSGATSIQALLSSGNSVGLFHKAWLTSPTAILNKTVDEACEDNKEFLKRSGCQDTHCLRHLTPEQVSKSSPWPLDAQWTLDELFSIPRTSQIRNALPIFDGHVVHLRSMINGPIGPVVPVVFGATYFDLSSLKSEREVVNMTWDDYDAKIVHYVDVLGTQASIDAKRLYSHQPRVEYTSPAHFPPLPSAQFSRLIGDIKSVCPVKILADDFAYMYSSSAPVYMYVASIYPSHDMKLTSNLKDTFVGWDIAAFFNSFEDFSFIAGQGDMNFQNILREEIMTFVKNDRPDAKRWETVDKSIGLIGRDVTVTPVSESYFDECSLWQQHGFFDYMWKISS